MSTALKLKEFSVDDAESYSDSVDLAQFVPSEILPLKDPQTDIPRIAKDGRIVKLIGEAVRRIGNIRNKKQVNL